MRNVAMPMSCARGVKDLRQKVRVGGRACVADLEDVFEWVCHFVPVVDEVLVSFAHDEI